MTDPIEAEEELGREVEDAALAVSGALLLLVMEGMREAKGEDLVGAYAAAAGSQLAIQRIVSDGRERLEALVGRIFDDLAASNDAWAAPFYQAAGVEQVAASDHIILADVLRRGRAEAVKAVDSMVSTSAIGLVGLDGKVTRADSAYRQAVAEAAASMARGEEAYQEAIRKAASSLAGKGVRVAYRSGVTRELYGAIRTSVMGAYSATMAELRRVQGAEFGADGWQVSAHVPCAADHDPYQGRRFSRAEYDMLQASLSRQLETGANCRHHAFPILMGVGKPTYTEAQLAAMSRLSRAKVSMTGVRKVTSTGKVVAGAPLSMERYDASQYLRGVERSIRSMGTEAALLETGGASSSLVERRIEVRTADYMRICREAGISPQLDRLEAVV